MVRFGHPHSSRSVLPRLGAAVVVVGLAVTLVVAGVLLSPGRADAACPSALFGATGSNGVNGSLYCIDPTTGASTLIGPLVDASSNPYGVTGLAFQPGTGVLFGSTTPISSTAPGHLITIDPATAAVTDVGPFGIGTTNGNPNTMSDITFDPTSGILYGNSGRTANFYTISLTTGAATSLGATGVGITAGGGLAANAAGTIFGTPDASDGSLFTYSKVNGLATSVATLSGAPFSVGAAINALAFNRLGTLFGVNSDRSNPALTHLVTINTTTGVITDVGASLNDLDAIAFQVVIATPTLSEWGQILLVGVLAATGVWIMRRRRLAEA